MKGAAAPAAALVGLVEGGRGEASSLLSRFEMLKISPTFKE